MGEVKVTFHGICTIMNENPTGAVSASPRRIVMVNASKRELYSRISNHEEIQPHYARMHIRARDIVNIGPLPLQSGEGPVDDEWMRFDLDQVSVEIANAVPGTVDATKARCLPHLRTGTVGLLSDPNPDTESGSFFIACIFRLSSGRLEGQRMIKGAGISILRTDTIDHNALLTIAKFDGGSTLSIGLRPDTEIVITNLPDGQEADQDIDFLLHYLTASAIPTGVTVPRSCHCTKATAVNDAGLGIMTGPGCSNSNYP